MHVAYKLSCNRWLHRLLWKPGARPTVAHVFTKTRTVWLKQRRCLNEGLTHIWACHVRCIESRIGVPRHCRRQLHRFEGRYKHQIAPSKTASCLVFRPLQQLICDGTVNYDRFCLMFAELLSYARLMTTSLSFRKDSSTLFVTHLRRHSTSPLCQRTWNAAEHILQ